MINIFIFQSADYITHASLGLIFFNRLSDDIFVVNMSNHKIRRILKSDDTITTVLGKTCSDADPIGDVRKVFDACLSNSTFSRWMILENGSLPTVETTVFVKVDLKCIIISVAGGGNDQMGDDPATSVNLEIVVWKCWFGKRLVRGLLNVKRTRYLHNFEIF